MLGSGVVACCLACEAGGVPRPGVVDLQGVAVKVVCAYPCNTQDQLRMDLFTACCGHYVSLCRGHAKLWCRKLCWAGLLACH
jgi:hypothetical protein